MSQLLKNQIRSILVAQRTILQEYAAFDLIIDFIVQSSTTGIPAWTNALTFNNNGTGSGAFATYQDVNGALRFWNSKTNGNIGNAPPTAVDVTENTFWKEVSPAVGSAIKEWAPGIFGSGLVIVYYDISGSGADPELYLLTVGARPFNSSNFATELAANQWKKLGGITSTDITTALGFTPENAANKATSLAEPSNTTYPTTQLLNDQLALKASLNSPAFTGVPTAPTAAAATNTTQIATTAYVTTAINNLINGAGAALDTLNELSAALGNDPNFATTVATSIATKWSLATGGTLTGNNNLNQNGFNTTFSGTGKVTFGPSATLAGFNPGSFSGTPSGVAAGDFWYNSGVSMFYGRDGSTARVFPFITPSNAVDTRIPYFTGSTGILSSSDNFRFDTTAQGLILGGGTITLNTRVDLRGISGGNIFRAADHTDDVRLLLTNAGVLTLRGGALQVETGQFLSTNTASASWIGLASGNVRSFSIRTAGLDRLTISSTGTTTLSETVQGSSTNLLTITSPGHTGGLHTTLTIVAGAFTGVGGENIDVNFNLARTVQYNTASVALQRAVRIQTPTYTGASATTITDAYSFYVDGSPIQGTGMTITDSWAAGFGGRVRFLDHIKIDDAKNIILGDVTGTKIGTSNSQKLSLWNAAPNVQPTSAITAESFVANTSGIVNDTATFGGYSVGQIVAALKRIGALA